MFKIHSTIAPKPANDIGHDPIEHARAQLKLCRADLLIGVTGIDRRHLSPECAEMAVALLTYLDAQTAFEAAEAESLKDSPCTCTYSTLS